MLCEPEPVVDEGDVEPELPGVVGFELADLQLDDHVPELGDVEEESSVSAVQLIELGRTGRRGIALALGCRQVRVSGLCDDAAVDLGRDS